MSLVWYRVLPAQFGGQKGIANFNYALAQQVPLICLCSQNNIPAGHEGYAVYNWLPNGRWQIINPLVWYRIVRFAKKQQLTYVIIEHPYHSITGYFLKKYCNCTVVTHCHNIEYRLFKSRHRWYWPAIQLLEKIACQTSTLVICKTEEDKQHLVDKFGLDAAKSMLIPYCTRPMPTNQKAAARQALIEQFGLDDGQKILLFNGTLDYEPNAQAVADIVHHLCPLLPTGYKVLVTGRNQFAKFAYLNQLQAPNFIMAGFVVDIDTYFLGADVYINPVKGGGGMQTKNIDAISYQLPVVCWQNRLQGIDVEITGNKVYSATPGDWKDFLARILIADIVTEPTPERFFAHYDFNHHTRLLLQRLASQPSTQ